MAKRKTTTEERLGYARTLCNGLAPGDDEWDSQITHHVSHDGDKPYSVDVWMADVHLGSLQWDSFNDGIGGEIAEAIENAGRSLYEAERELADARAEVDRLKAKNFFDALDDGEKLLEALGLEGGASVADAIAVVERLRLLEKAATGVRAIGEHGELYAHDYVEGLPELWAALPALPAPPDSDAGEATDGR